MNKWGEISNKSLQDQQRYFYSIKAQRFLYLDTFPIKGNSFKNVFSVVINNLEIV